MKTLLPLIIWLALGSGLAIANESDRPPDRGEGRGHPQPHEARHLPASRETRNLSIKPGGAATAFSHQAKCQHSKSSEPTAQRKFITLPCVAVTARRKSLLSPSLGKTVTRSPVQPCIQFRDDRRQRSLKSSTKKGQQKLAPEERGRGRGK